MSFPETCTIVSWKGYVIHHYTGDDYIKPINFWFSTTDYLQFFQLKRGKPIIYDCKGQYKDSDCFLTIEYIKE